MLLLNCHQEPGFWLRARKADDNEPDGFWLRARKQEEEPAFWLRLSCLQYRAGQKREPRGSIQSTNCNFNRVLLVQYFLQ